MNFNSFSTRISAYKYYSGNLLQPAIDTFNRGPDKKQQFIEPAERNKETSQFLGEY
jgi:hypothetical protein